MPGEGFAFGLGDAEVAEVSGGGADAEVGDAVVIDVDDLLDGAAEGAQVAPRRHGAVVYQMTKPVIGAI